MRERGILMSGPMVRALLDGRKTQTRRIVKCRGKFDVHNVGGLKDFSRDWPWLEDRDGDWHRMRCPYGVPGDRLWVRETFVVTSNYHLDGRTNEPPFNDGRPVWRNSDPEYPYWQQCYYAATEACPELVSVDTDQVEQKWKPSIHMPRWASRLTLELTGVRVERLHEIRHNVADLEAEGMTLAPSELYPHTNRASKLCQHYEELWPKLNGPASWDANPWVWVLTFTVSPMEGTTT